MIPHLTLKLASTKYAQPCYGAFSVQFKLKGSDEMGIFLKYSVFTANILQKKAATSAEQSDTVSFIMETTENQQQIGRR